MLSIIEFLKQESIQTRPDWLYASNPNFDREMFFQSRTVFYPASGFDGQPVMLCNRSHAAYAYVYVDQSRDWNHWADQLTDEEEGFRGYKLIYDEALAENQLRPGGWDMHLERSEERGSSAWAHIFVKPFARFAVLERQGGCGESHGFERFGILVIGGDGFASFDALYGQREGTPPPFLLVVEDYGFGLNWARFGRGGLLDKIACRTGVIPNYLYCSSEPWHGYENTGAEGQSKGLRYRQLYRNVDRQIYCQPE